MRKGFKGQIVADWEKLHSLALSGPQGRVEANAKLLGAVEYFLGAPLEAGKTYRAKVQEFVTSGNFPAQVLDYLEKFNLSQLPVDLSYQQVFDVKDFTGTIQSSFKLRKVSHGIVFEELLPGEKISLQTVSGAEVDVPFRTFGGGIEYLKTWWDDQRWWDIEDETAAFRNQQFYRLAKIHIALVEALSSAVNQAWDTNLVATLNNACAKLIEDAASTGNNVSDNPVFVLWAPLSRKAMVEYALKANYLNTDSALNKPVVYSIMPAFSPNFSSNSSAYLCLPKGQAKSGNRMNLELYGDFDILSATIPVAGYFRVGAAIGEPKQFRRVPFSG